MGFQGGHFTTNSTGIADLDIGLQSFIDEQTNRLTAINGSPGSTQFRSSITGRASITDLTQDLKPRMGIERIMTQSIYQLQDEFGPNGEPVYAAVNDDRGLVRFVGSGWAALVDADGQRVVSNVSGDYLEVTFYGTGLNLLHRVTTATTFSTSVDGGSETALTFSSHSTVLGGRNYNQNTVLNVLSGLSIGVHTAKIRVSSANYTSPYGFEILNESSSIKTQPGSSYVNGKKVTTSAQDVTSYSSGVSGTRGGRVLVYQTSTGSVSRSFQAVDAAAAYLGSADHTNEEIARTYHWREFGAGRSDDFSGNFSASSNLAFTLDDGTTSLVGNVITFTSFGSSSVIYGGSASAYVTLTFVGTGLDIIRTDSGAAIDTHTVYVDGTSQGNLTAVGVANSPKQTKIASGLPYGTHTVKIARTTFASNAVGFNQFIVYQPKKPSLPSGAVELGDYNVMANYVANATAGQETIGTGVLRKLGTREITYVGSGWGIGSINTSYSSGFLIQTTTTSDYAQFVFFGTGFDFRYSIFNANNATSATVSVDGSTNLSGFTTSFYGGQAFTASTGVLNQNPSATSAADGGLSVSNLSLGLHTVKVTYTAGGAALRISAFDIITPIHSHKSNLYADLQNTLTVGSNAISDSRKLTPVKEALPVQKAWAQAVGVISGPTTTSSTQVPMPDMSAVIKSSGGALEISWNITFESLSANTASISIVLDGVTISNQNFGVTSGRSIASDLIRQAVGPGAHKVDVYWSTNGGTLTGFSTARKLLVKEF